MHQSLNTMVLESYIVYIDAWTVSLAFIYTTMSFCETNTSELWMVQQLMLTKSLNEKCHGVKINILER